MRSIRVSLFVTALLIGASGLAQAQSKEPKILQALRAAPSGISMNATVMDWDGTVLRKGSSDWTCYPGPPHMPDSPMCFDAVWSKWAPAWAGKKPFKTDKIGVAYMMMGDNGSSNTDPYAEGPTEDNEWVVEGPHLMILVPDEKQLEGLPDAPDSGGPYVMWKGTPYVHIMVPIY